MRGILFKTYFGWTIARHIPKIITLKKMSKYGTDSEKIKFIDRSLSSHLEKLIKITGADVTVTGSENVPLDEPVLYVCNHQGNMDIPLLYTTAPQKMGFVAKKEMEKIPVLSYWMKQRKCVFMDREDPREAIKTINLAISHLKEGYSMAIFPEGTRSKGSSLGEFKAGSLRIALKSGVKVIPVTIKDTYKIMEEHDKVTPAKVSIHFSVPINASEYKDTQKLTQDVLEEIQKNF